MSETTDTQQAQPEQFTQPQPQPARKVKPAQPRNTNFLADGFEFISEVINSAERSFLDLLSALVPYACLLYTSPSPRDRTRSRMPSSA